MDKKVLTLSVKKEWFDKILSGEKKEEYREIKEYWLGRLFNFVPTPFAKYVFDDVGISPKSFTHVLFINGYGDDKPRVEKKIESIDIDRPQKGWCPNDFLGKEFFVIRFK